MIEFRIKRKLLTAMLLLGSLPLWAGDGDAENAPKGDAPNGDAAMPAMLNAPGMKLNSGSVEHPQGLTMPGIPLGNGAPPRSGKDNKSGPVQHLSTVGNFRIDSILASVNGQPVSLLDVVDECGKEEARIVMLYNGDTVKESIRNLRKKTLDEIVNRKLIVEDYQRDPFDIPRQNIENFLDEMSLNVSDGTRNSLKKKIEENGITLDDLEERAKERLIVDFMLGNLFFKGVSVTPQEVFEYYRLHGANFSAPPRIRLEVLFLPANRENLPALVKDIQNDLKTQNAKIFNSLVALHSAAPNAKNGGDLGWIETDKLRTEFVQAVDKHPAGFISSPVNTEEGVYFLRVRELDKGGVKPFDAVRNDITDALQRNQREKIYKDYVDKLRKNALIRYFVE